MEQWLRKRFELYARRDAAYVSRLIKELESEEGCLELLMDGKKRQGFGLSGGEKKGTAPFIYGRRILQGEERQASDHGADHQSG